MKQWNAPAIAVLDIDQTENGKFSLLHEGAVIVHTPNGDYGYAWEGHGSVCNNITEISIEGCNKGRGDTPPSEIDQLS